MMDPASIPQGADPIPSLVCVDAKRLRSSSMVADPVSKVLDGDDNNSSSMSPAPPLDDEDLQKEILLRLSPKPSSLPRASLVCKRWRNILSDPQFLKRFRKHHCKPLLLGFFTELISAEQDFIPVLDTKPDRIPAERFAVPKSSNPYQHWRFLGCRHGLAFLLNDNEWPEVVIWDPLTGQQRRVPFPPELYNVTKEAFWFGHAAVLCTDTEDGHVHGDCFSRPFKLVLTSSGCMQIQSFACLYDSLSGVWGNIASKATTDTVRHKRPSVLIGNAVYWLLSGGGILEFDIESQRLGVIENPTDAQFTDCWSIQLLQQDNGSGLGFAYLSKLGIHLWERKMNSEGVLGWVLQPKIIQLEGLFPQRMRSDHKTAAMVGYDEESNVIVLATFIGTFMIQLESMRFRRISESCWDCKVHYPYRNFYTAGSGVGWNWVDQKL